MTSVTSALMKILPNYCATYLPIAMVMIVNPIMYVLASKDVEMAVALPLAQVKYCYIPGRYPKLTVQPCCNVKVNRVVSGAG